VAQFHWDPDSYLELMRQEVPDYDRLQDESAAAAKTDAERVLELGTGTGETARRVLTANPRSFLIGLDASSDMLARARAVLPAERAQLLNMRLEDSLPGGPFDLVVSVLAVHHLDGPRKAALFQRVAAVLAPHGRFVLGDVIVPDDPSEVVTPIDDVYDRPSSVGEQMRWLKSASLRPRLVWRHRDLAVIVADRFAEPLETDITARPTWSALAGTVSSGPR
jgi:tRNA (cmo5U34)-methyltransferase